MRRARIVRHLRDRRREAVAMARMRAVLEREAAWLEGLAEEDLAEQQPKRRWFSRS